MATWCSAILFHLYSITLLLCGIRTVLCKIQLVLNGCIIHNLLFCADTTFGCRTRTRTRVRIKIRVSRARTKVRVRVKGRVARTLVDSRSPRQ